MLLQSILFLFCISFTNRINCIVVIKVAAKFKFEINLEEKNKQKSGSL